MKPYASYKPSGVPWLGEVPAHWAGKRLRDCVEGCSNGVWGDDPDGGDDDIPVIRVADFDRTGRQVVEYETLRKVDSGQRGSRALVPGDMLMEKSGGGEQQPVGMVVSYFGPEGAVCSNFVARMRSREGIVSRFMVYLHAYLYASRVTNISVKQTTGIQNLDSTAYLSEACFVPPPDEQQVIADYLDGETARIDALIHEKDELIGLLREAQASAFATTVLRFANATVGVNCNRFTWLQSLPANWRVAKVKHITLSVDQGISPQCESRPPDDGEWGVLKVGCVNTGDFNPMESKALPCDIEPIESITLLKGDVLISRANTKNLVGRASMADKDYPRLMLSDKHYRLRLDQNECLSQYLVFVLTHGAVRVHIEERATGASASMLNIDRRTIMDLDVPLPPPDVQDEIVREVQRDRAALGRLIVHTHDEITLLKELRAATIADAVLGRIDVRVSSKSIATCA